jgi:hypothetical protein
VPIDERVRQRQPDRLWLSRPGYYRSFSKMLVQGRRPRYLMRPT